MIKLFRRKSRVNPELMRKIEKAILSVTEENRWYRLSCNIMRCDQDGPRIYIHALGVYPMLETPQGNIDKEIVKIKDLLDL